LATPVKYGEPLEFDPKILHPVWLLFLQNVRSRHQHTGIGAGVIHRDLQLCSIFGVKQIESPVSPETFIKNTFRLPPLTDIVDLAYKYLDAANLSSLFNEKK
jgi:hypothetical protein